MEEPGFRVVLVQAGDRRADVIRVLRRLTGLSAWHSSQLLGSTPSEVLAQTCFEEASAAVEHLAAVGADAALVCDWCRRTVGPGDVPVAPEPCASPYWRTTDCQASRPPEA